LKIVICYAEFAKPSIFLSDIGLTEGKFVLVPQNIWWSYILQILASYFDWTNKTEIRRAGTFKIL